ncbi:pyruvate kinase [Pseudoscourfieldia marina]
MAGAAAMSPPASAPIRVDSSSDIDATSFREYASAQQDATTTTTTMPAGGHSPNEDYFYSGSLGPRVTLMPSFRRSQGELRTKDRVQSSTSLAQMRGDDVNRPSQRYQLGSILAPGSIYGTSDVRSRAYTKVSVTIGPESRSKQQLVALLEAGMNIARFDFSWGTPEYHQEAHDNLVAAMKQTRKLCATIMDLKGPEIAVHRGDAPWYEFPNLPPLEVESGDIVRLVPTIDPTDKPYVDETHLDAQLVLPLTYDKFAQMAEKGDELFIGRYLATGAETNASLYLRVVEIEGDDVICKATTSASLRGLLTVFHMERSLSGCSNAQNDLETVTDHDIEDLRAFAARNKVEYVCLSLTRSRKCIQRLRELLDSLNLNETKIVAKVESRIGLINFEEIIRASDAIFISRGNLGLDTPSEKFPILLKSMLRMCAKHGKPSLVSRVFDTMVENPRPTRAEATDVANLVLDGADAISLGAETFRGLFPEESVRLVSAIARQAEMVFDYEAEFDVVRGLQFIDDSALSRDESLASSAVKAADKLDSVAIIVVFRASDEQEIHSGRINLAQLVAKYRPRARVLALVVPTVTTENSVHYHVHGSLEAKQLSMVRGVEPMFSPPSSSYDTATTHSARMTVVKWGAPTTVQGPTAATQDEAGYLSDYSSDLTTPPPPPQRAYTAEVDASSAARLQEERASMDISGGATTTRLPRMSQEDSYGNGHLEKRARDLAVQMGFVSPGEIIVMVEQLGKRHDVVVKAMTIE